jgi:hypothetical protein
MCMYFGISLFEGTTTALSILIPRNLIKILEFVFSHSLVVMLPLYQRVDIFLKKKKKILYCHINCS